MNQLQRTTAIAALLISIQAFAQPFYKLTAVDIKSPACASYRNFDVGRVYFVEIANNLPGKDDYNQLIQNYQRADWKKFERNVEVFKRAYETSPLMEAVAFLELQAKFVEKEYPDPEQIKNIEKSLRETLLLYPKSTLVPVITNNAAAFFIKMGNYQKAHSLFETLKHDYPFHALSCQFELGIGESAFLIRDFNVAEGAFRQVLQKCTDRGIRVTAEARLADLTMEKSPKKALETYERLATREPILTGRAAPWIYFNAGELKFRNEQYASSKFYFSEFLRYRGTDPVCVPWAMKRMGDASLRAGKDLPDAIGIYLAVFDKSPNTDVGRYSRLHAQLLDLDQVSEAEAERRILVFDSEVDKIFDEGLRQLIFLEKGLALLSKGERRAIDYLLRLKERNDTLFKSKETSDYIRAQLLSVLERESKEVTEKQVKKEDKKDKLLLEPIEQSYEVWLKGTAFEKKAQALYQRLLLDRFRDLLAKEDTGAAINRLERWSNSGLLPSKGISGSTQQQIAAEILNSINDAEDQNREKIAKVISEKKEILQPFLGAYSVPVSVATSLSLSNKEELRNILKDTRSPASIDGIQSKNTKSLFALTMGKGFRAIKKYDDAEKFLLKVNDPELEHEALRERFALYGESMRFENQLGVFKKMVPNLEADEFMTALKEVQTGLVESKKWSRTQEVVAIAKSRNLKKEEMATLYAIEGRSFFEGKQFKKAVEKYESALTANKDLEKNPDLKFRLAKSYLATGEKVRAQKYWEDVVNLKDEFWTPLAQSELKLMELK